MTLKESEYELPDSWRKYLDEFLLQSKSSKSLIDFIGSSAPKSYFPRSDLVFNAFKFLPAGPEHVKVLIFGQDPYPRRDSAMGVAFYDGLVKRWSSPMSPSLRNIIKAVLRSRDLAEPSSKVAALRDTIYTHTSLPEPPEWFQKTSDQGVLWLNTALTFGGKDPEELKKHTTAWKPFIIHTIQTICKARKKIGKGFVCVLWGGIAKKTLMKTVEVEAKKIGCPVKFSISNHPAVDSFHKEESCFTEITRLLHDLGESPVDFMCGGYKPLTPAKAVEKTGKRRTSGSILDLLSSPKKK
ncbi:Uracil-DNA glycosylase family 1 like protein [Aduncisulcus paluster]|uniref:Uracil-DNA glycosylase family 1 like protein n=1 Tax=Aduncisulcus paluster TaxID=2918883 RepID=A0ABQ5L002_9EUKA|nr:Uracil-DNA glycosylase family 1 like protein [Aduncisulcus paluster]